MILLRPPVFRVLAAAAVLTAGGSAMADHVRLFVLTGQSNSLGATAGGETDVSPGEDPADGHVRFFWHNRADAATSLGDSGGSFVPLQAQQGGHYSGSTTHWGPEIAFGRTLYRAGVRNFGIIKASRGGGGNTLWSKDDGGHMYTHVVSTVQSAAAALVADGHTFEIAGLLYVQGESDSAAEADIAGQRLRNLVENLRADLPEASGMRAVIGGIPAAGATRDTVRARHAAVAAETEFISHFETVDLRPRLYDNLHFDKVAKFAVGERFARAFFADGVVSRHYGRLVFIGDSITQGGNGDHPGYRYQVFKRLAEAGVPIDAAAGYKFTGSVTGPQTTPVLTTPDVNGQVFENVHDGHYGWRASWINGRVRLPANRRSNNRGEGTLLNWTGRALPQTYDISGPDLTVTYPDPAASGTGNTGTTYTPDTAVVMIGINDLGDNNSAAEQVVADIGLIVDQLRAANPEVRVHLNRLLYTNQTQAMKNAVDSVNARLQELADSKNAASSASPVWVVDASMGFDPVTMTYDAVHPNAAGEAHVGDRIAAALGVMPTPEADASVSPPPHIEKGAGDFGLKFEGHEIWDGSGFVNTWKQTGVLSKSVAGDTDLRVVNPGAGGAWIEGTDAGWNAIKHLDWTFETRLRFDANPNGFMIWLGTGTRRILLEVHGDRTRNTAGTFEVLHDNVDGNFHVFRVAHDAVNGKYHVWRNDQRLTALSGADYDQSGSENRLILGDFTSGTFGNNFDVTVDHVRVDGGGAWLPPGADADGDGMPDAWEYLHFGSITGAVAGNDDDGDGRTNVREHEDGTDPWDALSVARVLRVFLLTGESNALGTLGTTDETMRFAAVGDHPAEQGGVAFFWDNRTDGTPGGDAALGKSDGWVDLGNQTGGHVAGNEDHWGPEIGFARMLWNSGHRDFAIVKAAHGGGGNSFWHKGSADDHMYQHLVATVRGAMAELPDGFVSHEISGLLYLQGESNSSGEADAAGDRLAVLVENLKADLPSAADMVVVAGSIAGTGTTRDTTRARLRTFAAERDDAGFAEANGLATHNQDGMNIHHTAESQILFGERMAAEVIRLGAFPAKPLPAWENLHAWYVADNGLGLDNENAVSRWAAMHAGNAARDLTRRVSGKTYRRDVLAGDGSLRSAMRFTGANDLWATVGEFGEISGGRSVAMLCRVHGSGDGYLFDGTTSSGRTRAQVRGGNWQAGVGAAWDQADPVTAVRESGVWSQHAFTFSPDGNGGTSVSHWVDGVLVATVTDSGTTPLGGLILGSNGGSPFIRLQADIAEVAVFDKTLDENEVGGLKAAWDRRWGVPTAPPFAARVSQTSRQVARFGYHPLLELEIDTPEPSSALEQVRVSLAEGTAGMVKRLALHAAGPDGNHHPADAPLAVVEDPDTEVVFSFSAALAEESRRFILMVEPERHAPLGGVLDAAVMDITLSGNPSGTFIPQTADPAGELTLALVPYFTDVVRGGQDGIHTFRIPGIVCDRNGVLHAVYDHRYTGSGDLPGNIDVGYSRSPDGGVTWSPTRVIMDFDSTVSGSSGNGVGDPAILHDPSTGTLWVAALWSFGNRAYHGSGPGLLPTETGQYVLAKSTDGGETWSDPINITAQVKDPAWRLLFCGPGHGLALRDGTLVFPSQLRHADGAERVCHIFSRDQGETWQFGSVIPNGSPSTNENEFVELDDGRLLFSMRTPAGSNGQRAWSHFTPGDPEGEADPLKSGAWSPIYRLPSVPDTVCQASVIQWKSRHAGHPREWILFANPASGGRNNMTLRLSQDGGLSWPVSRLLYPGSAAYSCLTVLPDGSIGLFFERDSYTRITFARVEEEWLWNPDLDSDGDGMPDSWELLHGLDPLVDDSPVDADGDAVSNLDEFLAGTDPRNAVSTLRAEAVMPAEGLVTFKWRAVPGRSYRIETSTDLGVWHPAGDILADRAEMSADLDTPGNPERLFIRARALR